MDNSPRPVFYEHFADQPEETPTPRPSVLSKIFDFTQPRKRTSSLREPSESVSTLEPATSSDSAPIPPTENVRKESLREYWLPDEQFQCCFECEARFNVLRRRHHCRVCGRIFCQQCSQQTIDGKIIGLKGPQRACAHCATAAQNSVVSTAVSTVTDPRDIPMAENTQLSLALGPSEKTVRGASSHPKIKLNASDTSSDFYTQINSFRSFDFRDLEASPSTALETSTLSLPVTVAGASGNIPRHLIDDTSKKHANYFYDSDSLLALRDTLQLSLLARSPSNHHINADFLLQLWPVLWNSLHLKSSTATTSPMARLTAKLNSHTDPVGNLNFVCNGQLILDRLLELASTKFSRSIGRTVVQVLLDVGFIVPSTSLSTDHPSRSSAESPFFDDVNVLYTVRKLPSWLNEAQSRQNNHRISTTLRNKKLSSTEPNRGIIEDPLAIVDSNSFLREEKRTDAPPSPAPSDSPSMPKQNALLARFIYDHVTALVRQDVKDHFLNNEWASIVVNLAKNICSQLHMDLRNIATRSHYGGAGAKASASRKSAEGSGGGGLAESARRESAPEREAGGPIAQPNGYSRIDIRHYVHVKKLVDNDPSLSNVVHGVVFSKSLASKGMPAKIIEPRVLMIASAITYEHNQNRMTWIDNLVVQEEKYLRNCVTKLINCQPHIIFVGGEVSHLAHALIAEAGITLFSNIKQSVLLRIACATSAEIAESVDSLSSSQVVLGTCKSFECLATKLPDGSTKFLTYLQTRTHTETVEAGCERSYFPCVTVLLRGPILAELIRVKRCLLFAVFAFYNASNELGFFQDTRMSLQPQAEAVTQRRSLERIQMAAAPASNVDYPSPVLCPQAEDISYHGLRYHLALSRRLYSLSASVCIRPPHLNTPDGLKDPLRPFYAYVVEWSSCRRLNDFLKLRLRVIKSEVKASLEYPNNECVSAEDRVAHSKRRLVANDEFATRIIAPATPASLAKSPPLNMEDEFAYMQMRARGLQMQEVFSTEEKDTVAQRVRSVFERVFKRTSVQNHPAKLKQRSQDKYSHAGSDSILDPRSYQFFSFLQTTFSRLSENFPYPCVPRLLVSVQYYGPSDLSLGLFLERFCFQNENCASKKCSIPMVEHTQRFVQASGAVLLHLSQNEKFHYSSKGHQPPLHNKIVCGVTCVRCRMFTRPNPVSMSTWNLSFVKFLDLMINMSGSVLQCDVVMSANDAPKGGQAYCPHAKRKGLLYWFAMGKKYATFRYHPVTVYEVHMPRRLLDVEHVTNLRLCRRPHPVEPDSANSRNEEAPSAGAKPAKGDGSLMLPTYLVEEAYGVLSLYYETFNRVKDDVFTLHQKLAPNTQECLWMERLSDTLRKPSTTCIIAARVELLAYYVDTEANKSLSRIPQDGDSLCQSEFDKKDRSFQKSVKSTDSNVSVAEPSEERSRSRSKLPAMENKLNLEQLGEQLDEQPNVQALINEIKRWCGRFVNNLNTKLVLAPSLHLVFSVQSMRDFDEMKRKSQKAAKDGSKKAKTNNSNQQSMSSQQTENEIFLTASSKFANERSNAVWVPRVSIVEESGAQEVGSVERGNNLEHEKQLWNSTCSALEVMSTEAPAAQGSKLDLKTLWNKIMPSHESRKWDSPLPQHEHPMLNSPCASAISIKRHNNDWTRFAWAPIKPPSTTAMANSTEIDFASSEEAPKWLPEAESPGSMMSLLTQDFDSAHSSETIGDEAVTERADLNASADELDYQIHTLLSGILHDLERMKVGTLLPDVYVDEQELTTIIAYALASPAYGDRFKELESRQNWTINTSSSSKHSYNVASTPSQTETVNFSIPDSPKPDVMQSIENALRPPQAKNASAEILTNGAIEVTFGDGSTSFQCQVMHARDFHQLRELCLTGGDVSFVRSLARCQKWNASGGKSGSFFLKTKDERFIIKQLSTIESRSFHAISSSYFEYVTEALHKDKLIALARIFGIFHVEFKNQTNGNMAKYDVLVIENLFFNCNNITHIYDLKGSQRNRLVNEFDVAEEEEATEVIVPPSEPQKGQISSKVPVLLDQNFINSMLDSPLYVRFHSKNALTNVLTADTKFLEKQMIMDYSLLLGIDQTNGKLVIGIIDYLRKFTIDKKLEMLMKQSISGAQGPSPTILMPEKYRLRLLEYADMYFGLIPDQWTHTQVEQLEHWNISNNEFRIMDLT